MSSRGSSRERRARRAALRSRLATVGLVGLLVVVLAGAAFVVIHGPSDSGEGTTVTEPHYTPPKSPKPETFPIVDHPLNLPPHPHVIAFGDSWAGGYAATPYTKGFLYVVGRQLGWKLDVARGGSGTGYLVGTPKKYEYPSPKYATRISQQPKDPSVDLVILQGSVNDTRSAYSNTPSYNRAVEDAISAAKAQYPNAELLVIGPVAPSPIIDEQIGGFDDRLQLEQERLHFDYVSPTMEGWLGSQGLIERYINHKLGNHPDTVGHAYLARRLLADLRKLGA